MLTTLLFLVVMIAVILGVYYVNVSLTGMRAKSSDELNLRLVSQLARQRLVYCYGERMQNLSKDCPILGVAGYEVIQQGFGECNFEIVKSVKFKESLDKMSYFNPVYNKDLNRSCLGKIIIYM